MSIARVALAFLMLGWASGVRAADDAPQLLLDTGGHMGGIRGLAFTPDGKQFISAGHDKTIRVWDWRAGKTVRTILGQAGAGDEGKIYALALSPDGKRLAIGGFLGPGGPTPTDGRRVGTIRIYDFSTGEIEKLLTEHGDVVLGLAFSHDGRRLISGSADNFAIIWDVENGRILHRLSGHDHTVSAVAFNRDGSRVVTASDDGTLKLWNANGRLISTLSGHEHRVMGVAFSPMNDTIVSAAWDDTVKFWNGNTGRVIRSLDLSCLWALVYTPDGRFVVCNRGHVIDVRTGKETIKHKTSTGRVTAVSRDSSFAATVDKDDAIRIWNIETSEDMAVLGTTGRNIWALGFSSDGCDLVWGSEYSRREENNYGDIALEIGLPCAGKAIGVPRPLSRPITAYTKPATKHGNNELALASSGTGPNARANMNLLHVKQGSRTIATLNAKSHGFRHQAYTFTPDGKTVLSGGANGALTAYDIGDAKPREFVGHVGYVFAVAASPDGKLAASGAGDKTVNIWNLGTRELIVTLFRGNDGEWVMWTPQGYYASSPNGDRIVGWQINKGLDQAADYVRASQLRTHFYRPDIFERAIMLASAKAAVAQARGTDFSLTDLLKRRPPAFAILAPEDRSHANANPSELRLRLEPNADPVESIEVLVNGRQATTPALRNATARLAGLGPLDRRIEVPLEQGENKIRVVARNKVGQTVRDFVLFHGKPGLLDTRGTLHVLAIGVDKYPRMPPVCGLNSNQSCDLRYAGKDARVFRDVLIKYAGPLYKDVKTQLLAQDGDKPPTKANIEDALGEILGKAGPEDTTVLFIAGHGVNDGQSAEYLFLPQDAELSTDGWRRSTVLSWVQLQNALHNTQGRRLMFADTCHSGGAYNARLVNDAANANIVVFSATDTQTVSLEFEHLAHGVFTYALIQGLEGKARRPDGTVTLLGLGAFISDEVASLTKDKQQPTFHMSGAKNFMLAKQ